MSFNQHLFPEYNLNSNGDMFPNSSADFGGWYI